MISTYLIVCVGKDLRERHLRRWSVGFLLIGAKRRGNLLMHQLKK